MPRHRRGWAMGGEDMGTARHSPLTIALLEACLLTFLKEEPRHGYILLNDLDAIGIQTIHPSVVYRSLRQLEDLQWIESDWDTDQTQGPPRRTYRLTAQGETALQNWKVELEKTRELITRLLK